MKLSERMWEYETGELDKWATEVAKLEAENDALNAASSRLFDAIRLNYISDSAIEEFESYLRGTIKGTVPTNKTEDL